MHLPYGLVQFCCRAYLHQIALKIMSLPKLNEGGWPSLDFMVLHELIKLTENQSKLQAMTEYYDIVKFMSGLFF